MILLKNLFGLFIALIGNCGIESKTIKKRAFYRINTLFCDCLIKYAYYYSENQSKME